MTPLRNGSVDDFILLNLMASLSPLSCCMSLSLHVYSMCKLHNLHKDRQISSL